MSRSLAVVLALISGLAMPGLAMAQADSGLSPADEILSTLKSRGYAIVENERTWLGRQRVVAEKDGMLREVVFIPGTGEILRDYAMRPASPATTRLAGDGAAQDKGSATGLGVGVTSGDAGVGISLDAAPGVSVGESLGTGRGSETGDKAVGGTP